MSTKFTKKTLTQKEQMINSNTLQLFLETAQINLLISKYVSVALANRAYESVTPAMLQFLSTLECGVNYASEIARQVGVSRQMVTKTVKELSKAGYLQQIQGDKRQKEIRFTTKGERLIAEAREILFELDQKLFQDINTNSIQKTLAQLQRIKSLLIKK